MASVPLLLGAHSRSLSPEVVLLNCHAERAPGKIEKPYDIRARAGLRAFQTVGSSRSRAMLAKAGLFGGKALILVDQTAYLLASSAVVTTLSGSLSGTGYVDADAGQNADLDSIAYVATGDALYSVTEAGGVVLEDFPGGGASSVCCHRGFVVATVTDTGQAYVKIPGDGSWELLSFVSAEYSPDPLKGVRSRGDQVVLLGSETTEVWALNTQGADPPLVPYGGMNFDFGCRSIRSAVTCGNSLVWVDNRCLVRRFDGGDAAVISDEGLAELIASVSAGDLHGAFLPEQGKAFYVLTIGSLGTWVCDLAENRWHRRSTLGVDYWKPKLFATLGDTVFAADGASSQVYVVDPSVRTDAGEVFPVVFPAFLELLEGQVACANVELVCSNGEAPLSGPGSAPVVQMRYSDDGGNTWGAWRERPLGLTGQYANRVKFNGLGTIRAPYGRWFQFRVTDPVGRRFSDLRMNV